jgi:hypothetical protein
MSLNDIQLSPFVTSALYKNSLVVMSDDQKREAVVEQSYKFLGGNKKNIVLIARSIDAVFVSEEHLAFITKLLGACKINLEDVAIINNAHSNAIISGLKKQLSPKILIFFGVEPTTIKLPIHFPMFKMQEYDGCVYLYVPSLEELNHDNNEGRLLKSKLWVCLKNLFEL